MIIRSEAHKRHAQHYVGVAHTTQDRYRQGGESVIAALAKFDQERSQIDAAWLWAQSQSDRIDHAQFAVRIARATQLIGDLRYHKRHELLPRLEVALEVARRLDDPLGEADITNSLGCALVDLGEAHLAMGYFERFLALAQLTGRRDREGMALGNLGLASWNLGDPQKAKDYYLQYLRITEELSDRRLQSIALTGLGNALMDLGEFAQARQSYSQTLAIAHEQGDRQTEAQAFGNLAWVCWRMSDFSTSVRYAEQQLAVAQELADTASEIQALQNLGGLAFEMSDVQQALLQYERALVLVRAVGDRYREGYILVNLSVVYAKCGRLTDAFLIAEQALESNQSIGNHHGICSVLETLGNLAFENGDSVRAKDLWQQALTLARAHTLIDCESRSLHLIGKALLEQVEFDQAHIFLDQALHIRQQIHDEMGEMQTRFLLVQLFERKQDFQRAIDHLQKIVAFEFDQNDPDYAEDAARLSLLKSRLDSGGNPAADETS